MIETKLLMQRHDWYFKYSDDHSQWLAGSSERHAIVAALVKTPLVDLKQLIDLAPSDMREQLLADVMDFARQLPLGDH